MSQKLNKLADIIRMAARSYDAGKRDTALKLVSSVASKIEGTAERKQLLALVDQDINASGIRVYVRSIVLGQGGTSVRL